METAEPYLNVFSNKTEFIRENQVLWSYEEGKPSKEAKERSEKIKKSFEDDYLVKLVEKCLNHQIEEMILTEEHKSLLNELGRFTSESGRALIGLAILQTCIKCIEPNQSVRLHKSSNTSNKFSWVEGISMRSLDKNFVTPVLRKYDLLKLNKDGFMMTRTLAENYPYSPLYKAHIQGPKDEWLELVELLESGEIEAFSALQYLIISLINKTDHFKEMSKITIKNVNMFLSTEPVKNDVYNVILKFIEDCSYTARVFEVVIHSLMQVFSEYTLIDGRLLPMTQMRSANKKHGNIGDIEIVSTKDSSIILKAWDAKYGKSYLKDELDELKEKIIYHPQLEYASFIVDKKLNITPEIEMRIDEFNIEVELLTFEQWVEKMFAIIPLNINKDEVARKWFLFLTESLCQLRRNVAPIDEPCDKWVEDLNSIVKEFI